MSLLSPFVLPIWTNGDKGFAVDVFITDRCEYDVCVREPRSCPILAYSGPFDCPTSVAHFNSIYAQGDRRVAIKSSHLVYSRSAFIRRRKNANSCIHSDNSVFLVQIPRVIVNSVASFLFTAKWRPMNDKKSTNLYLLLLNKQRRKVSWLYTWQETYTFSPKAKGAERNTS